VLLQTNKFTDKNFCYIPLNLIKMAGEMKIPLNLEQVNIEPHLFRRKNLLYISIICEVILLKISIFSDFFKYNSIINHLFVLACGVFCTVSCLNCPLNLLPPHPYQSAPPPFCIRSVGKGAADSPRALSSFSVRNQTL
jgi:hypothetical protein